MLLLLLLVPVLAAASLGCSSEPQEETHADAGSLGGVLTGGRMGAGGAASSGGVSSTGGRMGAGGATSTGGAASTGGRMGAGGATSGGAGSSGVGGAGSGGASSGGGAGGGGSACSQSLAGTPCASGATCDWTEPSVCATGRCQCLGAAWACVQSTFGCGTCPAAQDARCGDPCEAPASGCLCQCGGGPNFAGCSCDGNTWQCPGC